MGRVWIFSQLDNHHLQDLSLVAKPQLLGQGTSSREKDGQEQAGGVVNPPSRDELRNTLCAKCWREETNETLPHLGQ